jgi:hypothetical protein
MKPTVEAIVKQMHEAVEPIFQELAKEVVETLSTNHVLTVALEKVEQLEAEVQALRQRREGERRFEK